MLLHFEKVRSRVARMWLTGLVEVSHFEHLDDHRHEPKCNILFRVVAKQRGNEIHSLNIADLWVVDAEHGEYIFKHDETWLVFLEILCFAEGAVEVLPDLFEFLFLGLDQFQLFVCVLQVTEVILLVVLIEPLVGSAAGIIRLYEVIASAFLPVVGRKGFLDVDVEVFRDFLDLSKDVFFFRAHERSLLVQFSSEFSHRGSRFRHALLFFHALLVLLQL